MTTNSSGRHASQVLDEDCLSTGGGRYGNLVTWGGDQPCCQRVSLALGTCPEGTWRQAAHLALSPRRLESSGRRGERALNVGRGEKGVKTGREEGGGGGQERGRRRASRAEAAALWLAGRRVLLPPAPSSLPRPALLAALASRKYSKKSKCSRSAQDGVRLLQLPAQGHLLGHRWTHSEGNPLLILPPETTGPLPARDPAVRARRGGLLPG